MTAPNRLPAPHVYFRLQRAVRAVAPLILRTKIAGVENVPMTGPLLVVVNHLSILDIPLAFIALPRQLTAFVADKWRTVPGIAQICNYLGAIWLTRGEADMDAVKAALLHLKTGGVLGLAPEGTRSRTGQLQAGKAGAAYLADRAGVPILPVAVWGTENVSRNLKRARRTDVACVIGKPFRLPTDGRAKGRRLEELSEVIMCRLAALLPAEYRGVYAGHPGLHEPTAAET